MLSIQGHLDRIETIKMTEVELDAGFALALGYRCRLVRDTSASNADPANPAAAVLRHRAEIIKNGEWVVFSPTTDWNDFGEAIGKFPIVISTHSNGDEDKPGFWYGAHAYLSGTSFESHGDLRVTAARAAVARAKLLEWRI